MEPSALPRVCLVNPPYEVGESLYLAPQLGLLNIAAHTAANATALVDIVDLALELREGTLDRTHLLDASAHRLAELRCDEYGFSVQCFNLPIAVLIAKRLKVLRPTRPIYFGGHEVAMIRKRVSYDLSWIEWDSPTWFPRDAANHWHRLPLSVGPEVERYRSVSVQPVGLVEIARGCPFSCSFCSIPAAFGHKRSYKPIEQVREEILSMHVRGLNNFHFVDDTLTIHRERLNELLGLLDEMSIDIAWTGMTRVDLVDKDVLRRMARVGCYSLLYGVESANASQRYRISKGGRPYPDLIHFLQWHLDACIQPTLYFLVGMPGEAKDSLNETLRMAARLSALDPGCCHFQPPRFVPGTPLSETAAMPLRVDLNSQYAATLMRTMGSDRDEIVTEIHRRPDLYSTYYSAMDTVDPLAKTIGRVGDKLYARWPLTLTSLDDTGLLIEWLRSPQFQAIECTSELEPSLERFVDARNPELREVLCFERWLRDEHSGSILSHVDADAIIRNLREGAKVAHARHTALVAYRKSSVTVGVAT